jgi:hypothetical protein
MKGVFCLDPSRCVILSGHVILSANHGFNLIDNHGLPPLPGKILKSNMKSIWERVGDTAIKLRKSY